MPGSSLPSRRRVVLRGVSALAAVTLVIGALAGCQPQPHPYLTSVPPGVINVTHPARYIDEIFGVTKTADIHYSTADDLDGNPVDLKLDLYQPTNDTDVTANPDYARPAIVIAHGGGFKVLNKTKSESVQTAQRFAAMGYVAVSIDYRLLAKENCGSLGGDVTPESGCNLAASAAISDGFAAVRWLRANAATYHIDPNRIGMTGDSAGAIMAIGAGMFAGATNEAFEDALAGRPQNPLATALLMGAPANESHPEYSSEIQGWVSISGGFPPDITQLNIAQLVATNWPEILPAPGMFFHGSADNQVLYPWAETLRDQLVGINRLVVWHGFPGLGHVSSLWGNHKQLILDESTSFFYLTLGLGDIAP